jgi:transposase
MVFVGIDWSDRFHSFCVLDADGNKLDGFEIPHGQEGFESAQARLRKHARCVEDIVIAIETKDSLIVDFFSEMGYVLHFLNPKQTDRFRDRHRMAHSKSDGFDAYVLADALRTDAHLFAALSPLDEQSLVLRVLTRSRVNLVKRKVAVINELKAALKRYFPLALELFDDLEHPGSIDFLLKCPTYAQARTVSAARIVSILVKAGAREKSAAKRAEQMRQKLQSAQPTPSKSAASAYPPAVRSLLRQLRSIVTELECLDSEIGTISRNHPNKELIQSLPGIGEALGPVFAAEIGADVARFSEIKTLKAFCGSSPVTARSGKYQSVHFRRACNAHLRRALHLASAGAIITCAWARELYDRLKAKGKSHGRALRAVGDQLIEILYAVLRRRRPYDEAYHLRMKSLHGKPVQY